MPFCSVMLCRNQSKLKNVSNGNISYHRFPKDGFIKEKWIDATGKKDWMPTKYSTVCSNHFLPHDFIISKKGNRYLIPSAIPTQEIIIFINNQNIETNTAEDPKMSSTQLNIINSLKEDDTSNETALKGYSPTSKDEICNEKKLMEKLRWSEFKIEKQTLKIKRLQTQNQRYKLKILSLQDIVKKFEKEVSSSESDDEVFGKT